MSAAGVLIVVPAPAHADLTCNQWGFPGHFDFHTEFRNPQGGDEGSFPASVALLGRAGNKYLEVHPFGQPWLGTIADHLDAIIFGDHIHMTFDRYVYDGWVDNGFMKLFGVGRVTDSDITFSWTSPTEFRCEGWDAGVSLPPREEPTGP